MITRASCELIVAKITIKIESIMVSESDSKLIITARSKAKKTVCCYSCRFSDSFQPLVLHSLLDAEWGYTSSRRTPQVTNQQLNPQPAAHRVRTIEDAVCSQVSVSPEGVARRTLNECLNKFVIKMNNKFLIKKN